VDEIASESHISKKTIYEFFDSKENAFIYVIERESKQFMMNIYQTLNNFPSSTEKIKNLIAYIFAYMRELTIKSQTMDFFQNENIDLLIFQKAYEDILHQFLEEGIEQNDFKISNLGFTFIFIKAILNEGLIEFNKNFNQEAELQTYQSIIKLIS